MGANTVQSRALRPWLIVTGHKPMYCSSMDADNSRGPTPAGRKPGSSGHQILNGLELLYQKYQVDIVLAGHIHEYERSLPVGNNGSIVERHHQSNQSYGHYVDPQLPVYLTVGMAGYPHHIGGEDEWSRGVPWSATHKIMWGYSRLHFLSAKELRFEFISNGIRWKPSCNETGCQPDGLPVPGNAAASIQDTLLITKGAAGNGVGKPSVRGLQQPRLKSDDEKLIECHPTVDSTPLLTKAFSISHTIVTLAAGQTCVSEPLMITGVKNLTVILEAGSEIQAKRGSKLFGKLLSLESVTGVIIQGGVPSTLVGGTLMDKPPLDPYAPSDTELARPALKMWRQDYSNQSLYNHSEHRHALSIHGSSQVTIRNLRLTGSGGDGIYVESINQGLLSQVLVDSHFRQGMSIISAQGLLVVDSVFAFTRGTAPMAGIDFEPNSNQQPLSGIEFRSCRVLRNAGAGVQFSLHAYSSKSKAMDVHFNDTLIVGPFKPCVPSAPDCYLPSRLTKPAKSYYRWGVLVEGASTLPRGSVSFANTAVVDTPGWSLPVVWVEKAANEGSFDVSFTNLTVNMSNGGPAIAISATFPTSGGVSMDGVTINRQCCVGGSPFLTAKNSGVNQLVNVGVRNVSVRLNNNDTQQQAKIACNATLSTNASSSNVTVSDVTCVV